MCLVSTQLLRRVAETLKFIANAYQLD